jgi:hypothetical protein
MATSLRTLTRYASSVATPSVTVTTQYLPSTARDKHGIGLATAQRFVAEGAYVFITGRIPSSARRATAKAHTVKRARTARERGLTACRVARNGARERIQEQLPSE